VALDDVDLEGDLRGDERLGQVLHLDGREGVEVLRPLLPRLVRLVGGRRGQRVVVVGDGDGVPVGAVEDGGGADVKQHDGVPGAEVVLDRPLDGEGRLVGEVDRDDDACMRRWAVAMDARSWAASARAGGDTRGQGGAARTRGLIGRVRVGRDQDPKPREMVRTASINCRKK
jgi:hypothetical protein